MHAFVFADYNHRIPVHAVVLTDHHRKLTGAALDHLNQRVDGRHRRAHARVCLQLPPVVLHPVCTWSVTWQRTQRAHQSCRVEIESGGLF